MIQALSSGVTLSAFCREPGRPHRRKIQEHVAKSPELQERFTRAREEGFDVLAEEALEIAEADPPVDDKGRVDPGFVQDKRVRIDTRLRLLSKWCTARYGDRVQLAGDKDAPIHLTDDQLAERLLSRLGPGLQKLAERNGSSNGSE